MEFVIWVETRLAGRMLELQQVASVERSASGIEPEELGLTLQDGKTVLKQVQAKIVQTQVSMLDTAFKLCRDCGRRQRVKDLRSQQLRTVFGTIDVRCRRYLRCTCCGGKPLALWPLGVVGLKRNTPELAFLLAKWRSKVPYRRAAELLEPDEYDWPESHRQPVPTGQRLTVSIDGTYVRSTLDTGLYQHYVVSGRVECDGNLGGRFAWIARWPTDSVEFMKAALEANGWTPESKVVVLADGADGLKSIVQAAIQTPPRSILGRVLALGQRSIIASTIEEKLPRIRHQMWNGSWHAAMQRM
jgi:hypothetical protein